MYSSLSGNNLVNRTAKNFCSLILFFILSFSVGSLKSASAAAPATETKKEESTTALADGTRQEEGSEVTCQVAVFYSWKKQDQPKKSGNSQDSELLGSTEVFSHNIFETAASEQKSLDKIKARLPQAEAQAAKLCRGQHEDQAGCISSALKNHGTNYNLMDFAARRALLEAISNDCSNLSGSCTGTKAAPPKCFAAADAKAPSTAQEGTPEDPKKAAPEKGGKKKN